MLWGMLSYNENILNLKAIHIFNYLEQNLMTIATVPGIYVLVLMKPIKVLCIIWKPATIISTIHTQHLRATYFLYFFKVNSESSQHLQYNICQFWNRCHGRIGYIFASYIMSTENIYTRSNVQSNKENMQVMCTHLLYGT